MKYQILYKSVVRAELFHVDGQMGNGKTNMTKLTVAFCSSASVPRNTIFTKDLQFQQQ
jgi:hypothetical protein